LGDVYHRGKAETEMIRIAYFMHKGAGKANRANGAKVVSISILGGVCQNSVLPAQCSD
jgi:hypothetical protein